MAVEVVVELVGGVARDLGPFLIGYRAGDIRDDLPERLFAKADGASPLSAAGSGRNTSERRMHINTVRNCRLAIQGYPKGITVGNAGRRFRDGDCCVSIHCWVLPLIGRYATNASLTALIARSE